MNYKTKNISKERFTTADDQNELSSQQNLIFDHLQMTIDKDDIYLYLNILSETLTNQIESLNSNFYSEWFINLIRSSLNPQNPVLCQSCIFILAKLFYIFKFEKLKCFVDEDFINIYFNLLDYFNTKFDFVEEDNNDPIISIRIKIVQMISIIASNDDLVSYCVGHANQIINYLDQTKNESLILLYSSFILHVIKYEQKMDDQFQINLPINLIIKLTTSNNTKIQIISMEIFSRYLHLCEKSEAFISLQNKLTFIIPNFIKLLDDISFEIVSASLRFFETLYSIKISFENSQFHPTVYNKLLQLMHHHSPTVRYSAVKCINAFISNHVGELTSNNELTFNLISMSEKEGIDTQMNAICSLANIILKSNNSCLSQLPIHQIFQLFTHVLEFENFDSFFLIFEALYALIDLIETSDNNIEALQPLLKFDIEPSTESTSDRANQIKQLFDTTIRTRIDKIIQENEWTSNNNN